MSSTFQNLRAWRLGLVLAAVGAAEAMAHIAFFTFAPPSLLPQMSNGLVDPYSGVYASVIEFVLAVALAAWLAIVRARKHKAAEGFGFWLALTSGYYLAGIGTGLATGAYS